MSKIINFIYNPDFLYTKVLDSLIDPILMHLPNAIKSSNFLEGQVNVNFFVETKIKRGIFISHGLADKNWRNADSVSEFDFIFVSGPLWKKKLINQGISENKIFINGFTKLDPAFQYKKNVHNDSKIYVLYAPTHNISGNSNFISSYPRLIQYFKNAPKGIEIINSFHPANNYRNITLEEFKSADVVISDCSSTLYEAWALGIPVVFPDWLVKDHILANFPGSFEYIIYSQHIGYHSSNIHQMWDLIIKAKAIGIDSITKNFIEGIFPSKLRGISGKKTAEILLNIAKN